MLNRWMLLNQSRCEAITTLRPKCCMSFPLKGPCQCMHVCMYVCMYVCTHVYISLTFFAVLGLQWSQMAVRARGSPIRKLLGCSG